MCFNYLTVKFFFVISKQRKVRSEIFLGFGQTNIFENLHRWPRTLLIAFALPPTDKTIFHNFFFIVRLCNKYQLTLTQLTKTRTHYHRQGSSYSTSHFLSIFLFLSFFLRSRKRSREKIDFSWLRKSGLRRSIRTLSVDREA